MRIIVQPTGSPSDLVDYLKRCGCDAELRGRHAVEALPRRDVSAAHSRLALDAYLRVWRSLHPTVSVQIVESASRGDGAE